MGFETLDIFALLMLAAFAAGFVDAIAGGGGLITVPALMLIGMSPLQALATNKLQGLFGAGTAAVSYASKGHVNLRKQAPLAFLALIASAIGALAISHMPADFFRPVLPILLITIALFFAFKPGLSDKNREQRLKPLHFALTIVPIIAFYDGFFGPGTGSFFMIAFVALAGQGILKATAHTKLLNFASNVGGFILFAFVGAVAWQIGIAMGLAQIAGAVVGSRLAMKNGASIIKPLLVIVCLAMAARLWWRG